MKIDCRGCGAEVEPFMSFGPMPISNGFVSPQEVAKDSYRFDLSPGICSACSLFQLMDQPNPEQMFHDEYAFYSQTSSYMSKHFESFASDVRTRHIQNTTDPFVVELGSNDGIMLRHFASDQIHHLGVEPSANVAAAAKELGVKSLVSFFDEDTAKRIVSEHGQADAVLAANVMCHISDIQSVARGIDFLLKPGGVLIFEDPYLGEVLQKGSFDQIYDEHVFLFSLQSVSSLFSEHNLEVIDVSPQTVHGGSMRYTLARPSAYSKSPSTDTVQMSETDLGISNHSTYLSFAERCEDTKNNLKGILQDLKKQGKSVAGYGATSKSTTVLNYSGIGPDLIAYISDTTPGKQGKLTPGSHIPITPYDRFNSDYPDYAVLFAWNHEAEIVAKEEAFLNHGGRFIRFFPKVEIVES